jgi:hypothetical protein
MMSGEGGKLLAGAAGFYSPWGSESDEQSPLYFAPRFLFVMLKETLRIVHRFLHSASLPSG